MKPGRKPKGDRKAMMVRVPRTHYDAFAEAARDKGLSLSDYLNEILARAHDLEVPAFVYVTPRRTEQEELPISA